MTKGKPNDFDDIIVGAEAIGKHMRLPARRIYILHGRGAIPTFRIGGKVCARGSTIARYIAEQEARCGTAADKGGSDMGEIRRPATLADDLLDGAEEIAEFIGGNMTPRKVFRMIEDGMIPAIRKGRRIYARKSEIERAFSSGTEP